MTTHELAADLGFSVVLVLIAEVVVQLTQVHRLYALTIVLIAGNALRAVVQYWRKKRAQSNEDLPPEHADASGRRPNSQHRPQP